MVLNTRPYDAISWTGESVDVEQSQIQGELSVEQMLEEAGFWLLHDMAVLNVFARFYTGGDLRNDVDDIVLGLDFLAREPGVDLDRIGIYGGSWGGFEALFGAADAPTEATPSAGVALYPPSDFSSWTRYVLSLPELITDSEQLDTWQTFFSPYLDRVYASTGGPPDVGDYSQWSAQHLLGQLDTAFMLIHDQWDTLVPFSLSVDLSDAAAQQVQLLSYRYAQALDFDGAELAHGALQSEGYIFPVQTTFSLNYLLTRLAGPSQIIYAGYELAALTSFLGYLKEQQSQQAAPGYGLTGLVELCDDRVVAIDMEDIEGSFADPRSGAQILAPLVNLTWCTDLSAQELGQTLAQGLPQDACP